MYIDKDKIYLALNSRLDSAIQGKIGCALLLAGDYLQGDGFSFGTFFEAFHQTIQRDAAAYNQSFAAVLTHQDTAFGVFRSVAYVDADALEARH